MYLVICIVENTKGQKTESIDRKATESAARSYYHTKLASYNNANDVKQATVLIMTKTGVVLPMFRETVIKEVNE